MQQIAEWLEKLGMSEYELLNVLQRPADRRDLSRGELRRRSVRYRK